MTLFQKDPFKTQQEKKQDNLALAKSRSEVRQRLYGAATQRMLMAVHLKAGNHVLDIAAGAGDQGRQAARLVGQAGTVLLTDISQEMLHIAAQLAQREELSSVTTRVMNAEQLDLPESSYDAVISRLGLMLIARQAQALSEIQRVLKPGGRFAALVWSAPAHNSLFTLYINTVMDSLKAEELDKWSDPFSLADAAFFARTLTAAGFQQVQIETISITFSFPSFEALTTWWGSDYDEALARLEPKARQRTQEKIHQAVYRFERPQGIIAPGELLLGTGTKANSKNDRSHQDGN